MITDGFAYWRDPWFADFLERQSRGLGRGVSYSHAYAVLTWIYAAGFGITAAPVAVYLLRRGTLPEFFGLFPMYGGPWSSRVGDGILAVLL